MAQVETIHPDDYNNLRARVQLLKQQHIEAIQKQHAHREVDLASIASRCAELEALNDCLTGENEKLHLQLRQNTERAAKLRRQQERENQKLREQIEKLTAAAASVDQNWADRLAKSEAASNQRIEQLQAEIAALKQQQDAEVERIKREHEDTLKDLDEWCRGEIEAVQHNARTQVAQAHAAVEQWQQKYDEIASARRKLSDGFKSLQRETEQLHAGLRAREEELQQASAAMERLAAQRAQEREEQEVERRALREHYAQLLESKRAQHAEQLAHIEGRLQGVVAKKDATIAALRAELQSTYSTLLPLKTICATERDAR